MNNRFIKKGLELFCMIKKKKENYFVEVLKR